MLEELQARLTAVGRYTYAQRFRGGLVLKAHRLLYHSTLGLRVIKKKTLREKASCLRKWCTFEKLDFICVPFWGKLTPPPTH